MASLRALADRMIDEMSAAERWQLLHRIAARNPALVHEEISRAADKQPVRILALRVRPPRGAPPPQKDTEAAALWSTRTGSAR